MKKISLLIILSGCYSMVYGQFKLTISYQEEHNKQNYEQLTTFAGGAMMPIFDPHRGTTTQLEGRWIFSHYLSVFTGLGYSLKEFNPNLGLPLFGILTPDGDFISDPTLRTHRFSNVEIPFGVRFNIPEYQNFEVGLSVAIITAFTMKETEFYGEGDVPFPENTWSHYGNRLDLGLDVLYNINKSWGVLIAYTWSPLDYRTINLMAEGAIGGGMLLSNNNLMKSGQQGVKLGIVRSF